MTDIDNRECHWDRMVRNNYSTECDRIVPMESRPIRDLRFAYCPYCGGDLIVTETEEIDPDKIHGFETVSMQVPKLSHGFKYQRNDNGNIQYRIPEDGEYVFYDKSVKALRRPIVANNFRSPYFILEKIDVHS